MEWLIRWTHSRNHKDIGSLYFTLAFWAGLVGTSFRLLIRLELINPGRFLNDNQLYNVVVTIHGLIIIFFMVIPVRMGGFGNILVPLILGLPDMGFPRINNLSFWILPFSFRLLLWSNFRGTGRGTG